MAIELSSKDLKKVIGIGESLHVLRSPKEILKYMLVRSTGTKAAFFATDTETSVTVNIPATGVSGDFLLPISKLFTTFSKDSSVVIEENGRGVVVKHGKSKFDIPTPNPMEFPVRQSMETDVCSMPVPMLQFAIASTVEGCDRTSSRYALGGVNFESRGTLRVESTNGRTAGSFDTEIECSELKHIVPEKSLRVIRNAIEGDLVSIGQSANAVSFYTEDCKVVATVCEGRFPSIESALIPKSDVAIAEFQRNALLAVCAQAKNMVDEETRGMDLKFSNGVLKIGTVSADRGKFYSEVEASVSSGGWEVTVDLEYLSQIVSPLAEKIEMGVGNKGQVLSIFSGGYRGAIMGMAKQ